MSEVSFELWLEFEHWERQEGDDPADDAFNMSIKLAGGEYALNVWTYRFFERVKRSDEESGENLSGEYTVAPDLFVERLNRQFLTEVVSDLIRKGELKREWLVVRD